MTSSDFDTIVREAGGRKLVLHIGCGEYIPEKLHARYRTDDWFEVRLDIDESVKPHIVADMIDMSAVSDGAVQAVFSSHNIEHLYPHLVPKALAEIYRVITVGGEFLVTLPDLQTVASFVASGQLMEPIYDSPAGPISPIDILYGFRKSMKEGNLFMAHKGGFTAKSLAEALHEAGFSNLQLTRRWVDLWALGLKLAKDDPRRSMKAHIKLDHSNPAQYAPELPPAYQFRHPGQFEKGRMADELDIEPAEWQPLNLQK